jgi:eukaryotic-like serine/threonine-protein kinase
LGPDVIARELVRAGVLTRYQAAAVYQDKTKGLFIGRYLVLDKIGTGGMGMVFKARHRDHDVVVALKLMPPSFAEKRDAVNRFLREADTLACLNHPNIVSPFEVSEVNGVHYLAMGLAEGRDLKKLIVAKGPLPVRQAIDCFLQTARGLLAAHSQGIIHRDVKPDNLVLDAQGTLRVLDFGLARVESQDPFAGGAGKSLTESGTLMGTVDYLSPEQAYDSKNADARSDIYSLGCTIYYVLTGRPPFEAVSLMARLLAHRENEVPSLRAARPGVPKALDSLCRRMMAKDPANRPKTMAWVIAALEKVQDELGEKVTAQGGTAPGDPALSGKYISPAESRVATSFDISDLLTEVASEVHPPQMVLGSRRYRRRLRLTPRLGVALVVSGAGALLLAVKLARLFLGPP